MSRGGPAFPVVDCDEQGHPYSSHTGISKLDYFAAAALTGMCAGTPGSHLIPPNAANLAYDYAAAMLAESEKRK